MKRFVIWSSVLFAIVIWKNSLVIQVAILWFAILNLGVFRLRSRVFIDGIPRKKIQNKLVLTIDDGPDPNLTPELLVLLGKHQLQATFFVVGKDAKRYPNLIKKTIHCGHTIANHSYRHVPWLNFMLKSGWKKELQKTEVACSPYMKHKWFRPPYALMSPHLASALCQLNYQLILFDIRALDFGNRRIKNLAQRLLKNVDSGGVILFHGTLPPNCSLQHKQNLLQELDTFFDKLRSMNNVVSLDDYLRACKCKKRKNQNGARYSAE